MERGKVPGTSLEVDTSGVAIVTLRNPPVNALHPKVLESLFEHLMQSHARKDVKAIIVTGYGGKFCAGFDINQFQSGNGGGGIDDRINNAFVELLENGPKPTVAAIQGLALGGGCEVALACNARVATPGTVIGLPELQLGIIPGFGGTQRLPRVVGVAKAMEMMLTSVPLKAPAAKEAGLVDEIAMDNLLMETAKKMAIALAKGQAARMKSLFRTDRLEPYGEAMAVLDFARQQSAKRARGLQHPMLCIDAVQHGVEHGGLAGLKKEGECFAAAAALDTHKALVHIFFAQRATKKVTGVTDKGLHPRNMKKIAVLGGGLMGSGIATACILAGHLVVIKEINEKFMNAGLGRVGANLKSRVKKGKMSAASAEAALGRLKGSITYDDFGDVDMAACILADVGLDPYLVDKAVAQFGMPMGPFRLSDLVGADVGYHVGSNFLESFPERCYPARIIALLNDKKRLGEKTGSGFYKYGPGRKASPDPEFRAILEESRAGAGLQPLMQNPQFSKMSANDILEFVMFPVVNEGCRVIAERIVDKPADLDIATVMSMGFPAPRGGLIFWADLVGAEYIVRRLNEWASAVEPYNLSGFFKPCLYLESAAARGTKLEAGEPVSKI
eukprot:jgi/Picsp_1/4879/NSC_02244-R1_glyoxysomal fatty acid beta-oxidation multifunctional protein mfp-a